MSDDDKIRLLSDAERAAIIDQDTAEDSSVKQATREHVRQQLPDRVRSMLADPETRQLLVDTRKMLKCWNCDADLIENEPREVDGTTYCRLCEAMHPTEADLDE